MSQCCTLPSMILWEETVSLLSSERNQRHITASVSQYINYLLHGPTEIVCYCRKWSINCSAFCLYVLPWFCLQLGLGISPTRVLSLALFIVLCLDGKVLDQYVLYCIENTVNKMKIDVLLPMRSEYQNSHYYYIFLTVDNCLLCHILDDQSQKRWSDHLNYIWGREKWGGEKYNSCYFTVDVVLISCHLLQKDSFLVELCCIHTCVFTSLFLCISKIE